MSATIRLEADQLAELAALIAGELRDGPGAEVCNGVTHLVDASTLARHLGISRSVVYRRSEELGAVRIGNRLRFDIERAKAANANSSSDENVSETRPRPRRKRQHAANGIDPSLVLAVRKRMTP
jgi:hypothetical protein